MSSDRNTYRKGAQLGLLAGTAVLVGSLSILLVGHQDSLQGQMPRTAHVQQNAGQVIQSTAEARLAAAK